MSALEYEQKVISQNVSGVEAENKSVDFSAFYSSFQNATVEDKNLMLKEINRSFDSFSEHYTTTDKQVSLDEEIAKSIMVSGKYKALAEGLNRRLDLLTTAIGGRS